MKLLHDDQACTGHGRCYSLYPALFDSDDAGRPVLLFDELSENQLDDARRAVANCPERALTLSD